MSDKLWGGRFSKKAKEEVERFTAEKDVQLDERLAIYDIFGTVAHDYMLYSIGAISKKTLQRILVSLWKIKERIENKEFQLRPELEDIHMNIEKTVIEEIGEEYGGMMHLARSRNDQVLVDMRMYLRDQINEVMKLVINLISTFITVGEKNLETLMLGYTHTREAQPTTVAHWCGAYVDPLLRIVDRLEEVYNRVNLCPLGSGAISGVSWPIDRKLTANLLGFDGVQENTMDAISSRGEVESEILFALSLLMIVLSRLCEEIIWWSTREFGVIELDEVYTTGSSLMPQKKNPDVAELTRGRVGRIYGYLVQVLTILKGIPSGYNRDQQEIKGPIFHGLDTVKSILQIMPGLVSTIKFNQERMLNLISDSYSTATELVDLIIKETQTPFRLAHRIVGIYVKQTLKSGNKADPGLLTSLIKSETGKVIRINTDMIEKAIDPKTTIERRNHIGGPAPAEVRRMLANRKEILNSKMVNLAQRVDKIESTYNKLEKLIQDSTR
ncbi:MAG: argininosuccinate lyase [Candidatus Jordarchaeum sp.]|uniref:argininosuccinate lyase n=1 Tax=Candidatus Jordarchaeum sp. TaxID=2823881 RepID=UPI00404AB7EC